MLSLRIKPTRTDQKENRTRKAFGDLSNIFSHPDFTVGLGISPNRLPMEFADFTAGMEFHQSPKILIFHLKSAPRRSFSVLKNCFMQIITYARIWDTTPEPTVLPPSRIAKRRPSSQAMGVMSSTVISTLSPGRHISTPAGSSITPVTSVVLK